LLEAPVVLMEGVISVNGGAGGRDNNVGAHGEINFAPVLGLAEGGDGSDVQGVGGDGKGTNYAGGGGGGGGRIRINTATGTESFDRAIVLPVFDSGFATVGVVAVDH
jgi:hypothetical protein